MTAITRTKLSTPMKILNDRGLLMGECLDFGCGHGYCADALGLAKYDPNFFSDGPNGLFDTITCNYVLNVLPPTYQSDILREVQYFMEDTAIAYISVRRDLKSNGFTCTGTYQRDVKLSLPSFIDNGHVEIYIMRKHSKIS